MLWCQLRAVVYGKPTVIRVVHRKNMSSLEREGALLGARTPQHCVHRHYSRLQLVYERGICAQSQIGWLDLHVLSIRWAGSACTFESIGQNCLQPPIDWSEVCALSNRLGVSRDARCADEKPLTPVPAFRIRQLLLL